MLRRMQSRLEYFIFVTALLFAAAQDARAAEPAPLIVISIDGFRADYFDRGITPTLAALAKDGVRAIAMPSFVSLSHLSQSLHIGHRPSPGPSWRDREHHARPQGLARMSSP